MKFLRNQAGEAILVVLFGLMFTMVVAAKEARDLRVEVEQCETQQKLIMEAIK